jgi:hypothetical protein
MELAVEMREQIIDEEHLRLLTIGHYIAGGTHIAFASLFIFHFVFMLVAASHPEMFSNGLHAFFAYLPGSWGASYCSAGCLVQ